MDRAVPAQLARFGCVAWRGVDGWGMDRGDPGEECVFLSPSRPRFARLVEALAATPHRALPAAVALSFPILSRYRCSPCRARPSPSPGGECRPPLTSLLRREEHAIETAQKEDIAGHNADWGLHGCRRPPPRQSTSGCRLRPRRPSSRAAGWRSPFAGGVMAAGPRPPPSRRPETDTSQRKNPPARPRSGGCASEKPMLLFNFAGSFIDGGECSCVGLCIQKDCDVYQTGAPSWRVADCCNEDQGGCPLLQMFRIADGIMSPTFYPRPDGASSFIGGRVEVCLRRISRDSIGAGLRWICLDSVFVRLRLGVYRESWARSKSSMPLIQMKMIMKNANIMPFPLKVAEAQRPSSRNHQWNERRATSFREERKEKNDVEDEKVINSNGSCGRGCMLKEGWVGSFGNIFLNKSTDPLTKVEMERKLLMLKPKYGARRDESENNEHTHFWYGLFLGCICCGIDTEFFHCCRC